LTLGFVVRIRRAISTELINHTDESADVQPTLSSDSAYS
jgi:hypothetical protein